MQSELTRCRWVEHNPHISPCGPLRWIGTRVAEWEFAYCDDHIQAFRQTYPTALVSRIDEREAVEDTLKAWRLRHIGAE